MMKKDPWPGVIDRYRSWLEIDESVHVVSLGEGGTPLRFAPRLSERVGANVYLKLEGFNPTGSFKDRGMTMAVSKALDEGSTTIICASTGNTSASAAAYAAAAGIKAVVLIPSGHIALGKLAQALVYGAQVIQINGNFDEGLRLVRELAQSHPLTVVNSINPYRLQGQKTGAFEIVDELGYAPDAQFIPVGNAGNISAYWMGYQQYHEAQVIERLPRMFGVQAAGAAPIVNDAIVAEPETIATAIRIGNPASWKLALRARDESGGAIMAVTDEEILRAYILLARDEAVFCEPASAASVAGLLKTPVVPGSSVVCVLTGNGLKDPDTAVSQVQVPKVVDTSMKEVAEAIGL
ncbi:MAG: threonine synthase [Ferrimicrobium sp.]|nr:threonine synthase [Ferrimicrobium sp.]